MIIETSRLVLRDFKISDTKAYYSMSADQKYQRFYSEEDCSKEKAEFLVAKFSEQSRKENRNKYQMVIEHKESGLFIGTAGLRIEPDQQASIGCGVDRQFQSSGYAEEAMSALLEYGFNNHNLHRVYAETISENKPAIRLCKKFGMREEAYFNENRFFKGKWWSTVVLAMLKNEWQQRSAV